MKRTLLFFVIAIFFVSKLHTQTCTAITYNVDLSASVDTSVVIQSTRNGDCCGGTNCIRFDLTINPACSYVNFTVENPAPPGNAAYYQVNCGPQTSLGTPICVVGQTHVTISFCKPGNDNPIYTIVAAGALQGSGDITVREGCTGSMSVAGLTPGTINWTSIYPGGQGAYDSYLSCTSACTSTNVTPLQGAPAYIDYKVSGFRLCGPIVNDTIRVYTTPQIAVSVTPNNSTICAGSSTTLTATASGGDVPYNYLWSTGQTGPAITVNTGGVYTISVTDIHNCLPAVQSATVSIAPVPNAPTVTSNSPVCEGSTLNLFASSVPAAIYSWTGPNGFTSSSQNPVINNVTGAEAGSYTVTVTVGQCTSTSVVTPAVINSIPATPVVSTNSPVCEGTNLNLTASLIPGASYSWTGPNNFTSSNQNPTITNAGWINAGTYSVTVTANGCTSTPASVTAIVNMLPSAPIVSTNSPLCTGSSIYLMAGTMIGATYSWTGPNGFTSSLQNPTITNASTNASGLYSVKATINGCTGPTGTASVIINQIPPSPFVSSNGPLCAGSTLNLTASNIAGASYSWSGPNGFTSLLQNPVINNATAANAGIYNTSATVNGCTSPAISTTIVIDQPAIANAGNNQLVCSLNQFVNVTGNLSGGTNSAVWTSSGSGNFSPGNSNLNTSYYPSATDKSAGSVVLNLTSTNNGACPASSSSVKITFAAAPSANAGSDQTVCANNANVFLNGQYNNASGIIWSSSGNGSFSPSSYDLNATYIPGTRDKSNSSVNLILKTTGNTACPSAADTILVTIKAPPAINSGSVKYVLENNSTILTPVISGSNLKYLWTPGLYLNNDTIPNPVCTPDADVSYKIISTDNFGCSSSADVFVKVLKPLQIPNVFTPNGDGINEKWEVKNLKDYADCKVEIFNRYGQLVYHSVGYTNEWDGTLNGKLLPAATYYYVINLKIAAKPIAGFVDIIR